MSDSNPPEPTQPLPVTPAPDGADVEVIGGPEPEPGRGGRRGFLIGGIAIVVAALLGGGAWAVYALLFAGGPQPEEALPDSTVAVLSVDLDPSAGQKIAALRTIRKFPALKKELGLGTRDDLRRFIFDKSTEDGNCKSLDYNTDVKPWIGQRAAIAAVDLGGDTPAPAIVLQIDDQAKAKKGFAEFVGCADLGTDFGYAVGEDYLVASDSTEHAKQILEDGQKKPLSDDAEYKKWSDKVGDKGVLNFYVAKKAIDYLTKAFDELGNDFGGGALLSDDGSGGSGGFSAPRAQAPAAAGCSDDAFASLKEQFKDFSGLAGTIRFAGGGMELSVVSGGLQRGGSTAPPVGPKIAALPKDTAIALGFGVPPNYAADLATSIKAGLCNTGVDPITEAENATGLSLPEDLQTVLGSALTLSLGGDAPADLDQIDGLADVPVGLVVHGDADKIKAIIEKVQDHLGVGLADIEVGVKTSDDAVVLSPSESYADELLKKGSLGDASTFADAVPDADRATGVFFIDFNSRWRDTLIKLAEEDSSSGAEKARENTEPLKSLGFSTWNDGGDSHFLLKLATD